SKTQVKFDNLQAMFQIVMCAVRESLAKNGIAPMIDFEAGDGFDIPVFKEGDAVEVPGIELSSGGYFNPFDDSFSFSKAVEGVDDSFRTNILSEPSAPIAASSGRVGSADEFVEFDSGLSDGGVSGYRSSSASWRSSGSGGAYGDAVSQNGSSLPEVQYIEIEEPELKATGCFPLAGGYVVAAVGGKVLMINVRRARQRLFFDRLWGQAAGGGDIPRQQLLFETVAELTPADMRLARECSDELSSLGFDFSLDGDSSVTITAIPADDTSSDAAALFEEVLQGVKTAEEGVYENDRRRRFVASLARAAARSGSTTLNSAEAGVLVDELLKCGDFTYTPDGTVIYVALSRTDIDNLFVR
ncbi:MAG: hypothetical protein OSJ22_07880, partial [Rikenellaceae bacterium]|nr:hypothetical protein [Rikenellaceae bacterium]